MIKCSVFVATSVDGFIARSNGSIDWLMAANEQVPPGEDCGYKAFMSTVDTLVMGRNTFEQVLACGPWPYGSTPVVVLSRGDVEIPADLADTVTPSRETPSEIVKRLSDQHERRIYVDGGLTIQSFLAAGLIDELIVTVIPMLLGTGKPLFGPLTADVLLSHIATHVYEFGFVQHTYRAR